MTKIKRCSNCKNYCLKTYSQKEGHSSKFRARRVCRKCIPDYQFRNEWRKDWYI